jgi:hypothetical protein
VLLLMLLVVVVSDFGLELVIRHSCISIVALTLANWFGPFASLGLDFRYQHYGVDLRFGTSPTVSIPKKALGPSVHHDVHLLYYVRYVCDVIFLPTNSPKLKARNIHITFSSSKPTQTDHGGGEKLTSDDGIKEFPSTTTSAQPVRSCCWIMLLLLFGIMPNRCDVILHNQHYHHYHRRWWQW